VADFLFSVALIVLATVALGLFRIFCGPAEGDRMMAVQLLGSGGVAVLLLMAVATATPSMVDVALIVALLATFASIAFVRGAAAPGTEPPKISDHQ
jgi:multicomponent Na+:H+ antiporter subunit F